MSLPSSFLYDSTAPVMSTSSDLTPSRRARSFASSRSSFGESDSGIMTARTLSFPTARAHSLRTTAESIPPLRPSTNPFAPVFRSFSARNFSTTFSVPSLSVGRIIGAWIA